MNNSGKVILIGAGPGNSGLMTIAAVKALEKAQIVLVDKLIGADILSLIPQSAKVIYVGKVSGNHSMPQDKINAALLEYAQAGFVVVRLKGGDPYLFGRGAEELELLQEAKIPFQVIPGISASLAVPSFAGIPVTHRDYSSSVHIITGHAKKGSTPKIDYESLVKLGGTIVFMMGFNASNEILTNLKNAGMNIETPAAMIQNGTLPTQRKVIATIDTLYDICMAENISSPAVLVVGKTCELSNKLDWFTANKLTHKTVVVTRPVSAGSILSDKLESYGCGVIQFPCIRMVARNEIIIPKKIQNYNWIVFTSIFGVRTFFKKLSEENIDIRSLLGIKFAAIGSRTKQEIVSMGIMVDYMPKIYDAENLALGLAEIVKEDDKILLFRASAGNSILPEILAKNNINYDDIAAYDTIYENPASEVLQELLLDGKIDVVTFTSASTVDGFIGAVGEDVVKNSKFIAACIGEQTAIKARKNSMQTIVSKEATVESLKQVIVDYISG